MKLKTLFLTLMLFFSTNLMSEELKFKVDERYSNYFIMFEDYNNVADDNNKIYNFDTYECIIVMDDWSDPYTLKAEPVLYNGDIWFQCIDQGILKGGVRYPLWIKHTEWPTEFQTSSPFVWLDIE